MTRCVLKNSYRYPLMVGLPSFYRDNLPEIIRKKKSLLKFLTGTSIAIFESLITCPVERLKVYFMTTSDKISYREFFKMYENNLFKELFRGYGPLFVR